MPEVDPEDLKTVWQQARDVQARHPRQNVATGVELMKATCKPGANVHAVGYRSMMLWVLNRFAQERLAPWVKDEQVSDAVFRTMATIPKKKRTEIGSYREMTSCQNGESLNFMQSREYSLESCLLRLIFTTSANGYERVFQYLWWQPRKTPASAEGWPRADNRAFPHNRFGLPV